ncbi:MAG: protein translocase subunit SecD [Lachnospiraceae bacterium]|nr:protein translocase subunit SecD [Lachnospiraceae bacterium]MDE6626942.1 protein translocase subunit SecD [Lachnospiraceae bacterium]
MKKAKRNSVLTILIFIAALALGTYTTVIGLGSEKVGTAKNIILGLDLAGGVSITYEIEEKDATQQEIDDTKNRLQQRADVYSPDSNVYQEGSNRISIEIPGVTDANQILEDMGKPGALEFIDEDNYDKYAAGEEYEVVLSGSEVKNANAAIDNSGTVKEYVVELAFNDEGTKKFAEATKNNIGKHIYIIYDGAVASAPTVQTAITGGSAVINGMADGEEAEKLAQTIRIGALPLTLRELRSNVVGATLGQDALSTTLKAGAIGMAVVAVIMIVVYLLPGVISVFALCAYVVLTLLCLNGFNASLTLPGLAGIVLTIGMAVDANVIIFTRIKEEIGAGNGVKSAIDAGFNKALSAILDSNITTLIAAVVLYIMGTGTIKGFALTLGIGIVLSMFTALFVTKNLLKAVYTLGLTNPKLYGAKKEAKVNDYVKFSRIAYIISFVAIVAGLIALPVFKNKEGSALNYTLEFTGGTAMTVDFEEYYDLQAAESQILPVISEAAEVSDAMIQVQNVKDSNEIVFKTAELTVDQRDAVETALRDKFEVKEFAIENISSTISGEMQKNAIVSVIIATLLMLIYIAVRFSDVKFGAAAVIALVHDVLVVFAIYSIGRLSVGNTFIACMLTIVGYSINATIIIFDRIRENLITMRSKGEGYANIVNASVSQTFTRTIYSSLTTFVMVFVLYIMGVTSIKEFALTLMSGIVCGAYSSVCITGPLWYVLKTKISKNTNTQSKKDSGNGKKSGSKNAKTKNKSDV